MKKIAFLFLVRDNHNQIKIWNDFLKGNENKYSIYVHPKNKNSITQPLLANNVISRTSPTEWGSKTLVIAELLLLHEALKDINNFKFILVSESCVPFMSFDKLYSSIASESKPKSIISPRNLLPDTIIRRQTCIKKAGFDKNKFVSMKQWFILNKKHVLILLNTINKYKNILNVCGTDAPDEFYISTVLKHELDNKYSSEIETKCTTFDAFNEYNDNLKKSKLYEVINDIYWKVHDNKLITSSFLKKQKDTLNKGVKILNKKYIYYKIFIIETNKIIKIIDNYIISNNNNNNNKNINICSEIDNIITVKETLQPLMHFTLYHPLTYNKILKKHLLEFKKSKCYFGRKFSTESDILKKLKY
jgi:hypothetical protein